MEYDRIILRLISSYFCIFATKNNEIRKIVTISGCLFVIFFCLSFYEVYLCAILTQILMKQFQICEHKTMEKKEKKKKIQPFIIVLMCTFMHIMHPRQILQGIE